VGIVTLGDIKDVPQEQWQAATVGQVMTGTDKLRVVSVQDGLKRALRLLSEGDFDQLPVVDQQGRLVGLLTRARILRWMQIREELKLQPGVAGRT
jgi:CBS domain-containing protein